MYELLYFIFLQKNRTMKTQRQIANIKAVILYILQSFPEGVDYIKLFKILYFAQRAFLTNYGRPLVEESFKAIKHGPVPTYTYKALQVADGKPLEGNFEDFLSGILVEDKIVSSKEKPNLKLISVVAQKCLDETIIKYKNIGPYDLSEMSHDKAWKKAKHRMQDDPQKDFMSEIDIARAGHASKKMIGYIREKQILKKALSL